MKVRDIMTTDPVKVAPDTTCAEAATLMKQEDCGSLPVVRDGRLVGIITDRDIVIRCVAAGLDPKSATVAEAMSADPFTIAPDASVDEAEQVMSERQVRRLPVVSDGQLEGIVVIAQLARREKEKKTGETLKEISQPLSERGSHARG